MKRKLKKRRGGGGRRHFTERTRTTFDGEGEKRGEKRTEEKRIAWNLGALPGVLEVLSTIKKARRL